ncbi:PadR family transcriptional regulator [Neobacillus mesonae]|uniref:PadR family transcriptional regulator n=1 Tax=Neobacillus mesonae TaxID=1193713 RepID=UPI00203DB295|nr:PadR family transcriptional regulator [Neobacillus mesonae]MCM3570540.1 PadR family transcriptional regulator [Neobacillus mesonae]
MEDRLKNLRKIMDQSTFSDLTFSQQNRKKIHEKINRQNEPRENILLAIMQLLVHEKTGYELMGLLRGRGIQTFDDNEGFLYAFLHRLEQSGYLQTFWKKEETKTYQLTDRGKKLLRKAENNKSKREIVLKGVLEG